MDIQEVLAQALAAQTTTIETLRQFNSLYQGQVDSLREALEKAQTKMVTLELRVQDLSSQLQDQVRINSELRRVPIRTHVTDENGVVIESRVVNSEGQVLAWCKISPEEQAALQQVPLSNAQKVEEAFKLVPLLHTVTTVKALSGKGKLFQAMVSPESLSRFKSEIGGYDLHRALRTLLVARFVTHEIPAGIEA